MRAEFINPFLSATKSVIETMAFTPVEAGSPALKEGNLTFGDLTGIIGMAGTNVNGNMVISFEEQTILKIVSKMLMEEFTQVNEQIVDAVGELTNMICGGAKRDLNELGVSIRMASPVMIKGKGVEINQLTKAPIIRMPFSTEHGDFVVEANLKVED